LKGENILSYRKKFNDSIAIAEETDVDKTEFVEAVIVKEIIDEIESEVNDVVNMLKPINGLSEIDEIKDLLEELSNKLY